MDTAVVELVTGALPLLLRYPDARWDYDEEADVLYLMLKPGEATDSDLTEDDIVFRYRGADVVGITVLHASRRDGLKLRAD